MSLHEGFNHQKRNLQQPHQELNCNCQQQQQSKIECNDNDPSNSGDGANDVNNENNHHNNSKIDEHEINNPHHMYYMDQALKIADQTALQVGEVPVGCVIVWQSSRQQLDKIDNNAVATTTTTSNKDKENNNHNEGFGIIISHGANMVNATRDATRHAEIVAIDRLITAGNSSDALCLSRDVIRKSAHADIPKDSRLNDTNGGSGGASKENFITTAYGCDYDDGKGWKKGYGWNNGRAYPVDILKECDLYVTVEPCIMCAAALRKVQIRRVIFGCYNNKFGGCGSILKLHEQQTLRKRTKTKLVATATTIKPKQQENKTDNASNHNNNNDEKGASLASLPPPSNNFCPVITTKERGYAVLGGVRKQEAIRLLQSFYNRENFHAPDEKRRKKDGKKGK